MKHLLLLIISILTFSSLVAQTTDYDYKFGDIPQEQLKMTIYDKDSTAVAVMLLNYCKVYYDIYNEPVRGLFYKHHFRIKVLNKDKFKEKDIKLYANYYNDIQEVTAQTINYIDGKAEHQKVEKIFEEGENEGTEKENKRYSFSFSNIQNGSVLEYQYTTFRLNYRLIVPFFFQHDLPVIKSEYHFAIPQGRNYTFLFKGREKPVKSDTQTFNAFHLTEDCVDFYWIYEDVPAMKKESYVTTMDNYRANITVQLNSNDKPSIINQANGVSVSNYAFLKDWSNLGRIYIEQYNRIIEKFGIIKPMYKDIADEMKLCKTQNDSINTICNFVATSIKWNGIHHDFCNENLRDVYDRKIGTSAEINYALLSLFYHYNIEAFPVLISTRDNGKLNQSYPYAFQFNHVIAAIKQGEKWLFVDATDNTIYNNLPIYDLNYNGLIIEKDKKTYFIDIPFPTNEEATFINGELTADGVLNATMNIMKTNYAAYNVRSAIAAKGVDDYKENYFSGSWETATVSDIKHKNLEQLDKRLSESVTFSATDVGQVSGDFIYWDLFMGLGLTENPFQLEERNYPVELPYKMKETFIFQIKIPEGYALESLPQPRKYSLPNKEGSYLFSVEESNGMLKVNSTLKINRADFKIHQYQAIKDLFANVIEAQTTQIVLKKK